MKLDDPVPLSKKTRNLLNKVNTASITSQLRQRGLLRIYLKGLIPVSPKARRFIGPAFTVRFIPMREDITIIERVSSPESPQRRAIEEAPAGSVICMDCRGDTSAGMAGDILVARLKVRKVEALVVDGGMRDVEECAKFKFPIFCGAPSAPASFVAHHAADLQVPISCGGAAVLPGDILVGDADGVVVIPSNIVGEVAAGAVEQEQLEAWTQKEVLKGRSTFGLYPPNADTLKQYEAWKKKKKVARQRRVRSAVNLA